MEIPEIIYIIYYEFDSGTINHAFFNDLEKAKKWAEEVLKKIPSVVDFRIAKYKEVE